MNKNFFDKKFDQTLEENGWTKIDAGCTKDIDYNKRCAVYVKTKKIAETIKTSAFKEPENPYLSTNFATPENDVIVNLKGKGDVNNISDTSFESFYDCLLVDDNFVRDMRCDNNNLIIRCDCCWFDSPANVIILKVYRLKTKKSIFFTVL